MYNNDQPVRNGFVNYVTMNFNLNDKYFFSLFSAHQICRFFEYFSCFILFFFFVSSSSSSPAFSGLLEIIPPLYGKNINNVQQIMSDTTVSERFFFIYLFLSIFTFGSPFVVWRSSFANDHFIDKFQAWNE